METFKQTDVEALRAKQGIYADQANRVKFEQGLGTVTERPLQPNHTKTQTQTQAPTGPGR